MKKEKQTTLLLVDDNSDNLRSLREILTPDYICMQAVNGERALAMMARKPDLVLLDIDMPVMDGFEVCRRIRANPETAETPVIFVTAQDQVKYTDKGFAVGGNEYIQKPIIPGIIRPRVAIQLKLLEQKKALERQLEDLKKDDVTGLVSGPELHSLLRIQVENTREKSNVISAIIYLRLVNYQKLASSEGTEIGDRFQSDFAEILNPSSTLET